MDDIRAGSWVVVAFPPRCPMAPKDDGIGKIFRVKALDAESGGACCYCSGIFDHRGDVVFAIEPNSVDAWPLYRLKKIGDEETFNATRKREELTV